MLDIEYQVNPNFLESIRGSSTAAVILEGLVVVQLIHFQTGCILPHGIPCTPIQFDGMVVIVWYFVPVAGRDTFRVGSCATQFGGECENVITGSIGQASDGDDDPVSIFLSVARSISGRLHEHEAILLLIVSSRQNTS